MSIGDSESATILFEHYRDSRQRLNDQIKQRLHVFLVVFAVNALIVLQAYQPTALSSFLLAWTKHYSEVSLPKGVEDWISPFVGTVLWFIVSTLVVEVFAAFVVIGEQVNYLRLVERRLCERVGSEFIDRERNPKPDFLIQADDLYSWVFPLGVWAVAIVKFARQIGPIVDGTATAVTLLFDMIDLVMVLIIIRFSYLFMRWRRDRKSHANQFASNPAQPLPPPATVASEPTQPV